MDTKTIIRVSVVDQKMQIVEAPLLASGGVNEAAVVFDFCDKWNGYTKNAFFYRSEDALIEAPLDENDTCIVPSEVYKESGRFSFLVVGEKDSTTKTTLTLRYRVRKGLPSGESSDSGIHTANDCVKSVNGNKPDANGNVEITIPDSSQNVDLSGYVQFVNGVEPDENGNVEIEVGGTVSNEQIAQAVVDYLTANPVEGGMTKTEKNLVLTLFRNAAYTSATMNATLTQLETLWNGSGEDSGGGEEPHSHSYTSAVTKAATCTNAGVRTYTCSCGHSYTASIPATGHKWNNGVVTVEPAEGKEGVRTYTCTVCGETYTETIAALDHEHNYVSTVIAPTCTEQGYTEHICACGHNYKDTYVNATGHNYVDGICAVCGAADPSYVPEVVLTSISATYSGGDVAVGTAVSDLAGIVVTAHYSDGTGQNVTSYTLSGTIAEGSNTITVSYGGKSATFTVNGVAESGGIVNLFDKDTMVVSGALVGTNGAISNSASSKYAKIPISVGTYALQKGSGWGSTTTGHPAFIDADGNVLAAIYNLNTAGNGGSVKADIATCKKASGNDGVSITVLSEKVTHFIFSIRVNGGVDDTDSTMMEVGDTCHDYVPYV